MTKDPWIICGVCSGEGVTINPDIDAHGLTREDFDDDPDFAEEYKNGTYNISCRACSGSGKMRSSKVKELKEAAEDRQLAARENGDWDSYCVAGDWRYGT